MNLSEKEKKRKFIEQLKKGETEGSWCLMAYDRCPKCKTKLEFRGKERKTSKFTKYSYELFCPKCGEITCIEAGKRRTHSYRRSIFGRHAGDIGERFANKILIDAKYETRSFAALSADVLCKDADEDYGYAMLRKGKARMFLKDKYEDFISFCEAWNQDPEVPSTIRGVRPHGTETFLPGGAGVDLVGKKDNKFYLIEIKTNRAALQGYQKKMLLKSKEFGFIPLVLRVKVKINVPEEEVKWKLL